MSRNIFTVLILCLALSSPILAQESGYTLHTVQQGQGLYSISRLYGVTEADIIALNPGSDQVIKTGQQLRIPTNNASAPKSHTVQAGETLYSLAKSYGTTVDAILNANPGVRESGLKAGQSLLIPTSGMIQTDGEKGTVGEKVQTAARQPEMMTHTVTKKETIYKISKKYGISQSELIAANPQLKYEKLKTGDILNIPQTEVRDKDSRKKKKDRNQAEEETVPSIYVKENTPEPQTIDMAALFAEPAADRADAFVQEVEKPESKSLEVALIMPFELDNGQTQNQRKMVEFYQGMLLAIDKQKQAGKSISLHVYDTGSGNKSISSILARDEMANMDIIFGPKYERHVAEAAVFARENQIPLVLPLNSEDEALSSNRYVYQLTTPQSYMVQEVVKSLLKKYRQPQFIFISTDNSQGSELVSQLRSELDRTRNSYVNFRMDFDVDSIAYSLIDTLSATRPNIFVLNNSTGGELGSVLPVLQLVTREKDAAIETHLLGYPEYQAYAYDHMDELFEVDTWFYSWFYMNNRQRETVLFDSDFRHAFSRQLMQSYPNYAAYGYDTALFFLNNLQKHGDRLPENFGYFRFEPIQMGFRFQRSGLTGAYVNHNVFLIHLSDEYKIRKEQIE